MGTNQKRAIGCWISFILCLATSPSFAWVFDVTNTNDTTQLGSLRGDILIANWLGGNNTIRLGPAQLKNHPTHPWVFHLTLNGTAETSGKTGDLNITRGNLTIIGLDPDVRIDATGLGDRVFLISRPAKLTLENLTITGGKANGNGSVFGDNDASGGAINNLGTLVLDNCMITNNASGDGYPEEGNGGGISGGDGGGIFNSGILTMTGCTLAYNLSGNGVDGAFGGNGGGILNLGTVTLKNSLIAFNSTGAGGGPEGNAVGFGGSGGNGGGIENDGRAILTGCWIDNNSGGNGADGTMASGFESIQFDPGGLAGSGGSGAGLYNTGDLQINFCTVSSNLAGAGGNGGSGTGEGGRAGTGGNGAGIFNSGILTLNSSTISRNQCGNSGGAGAVGFLFGPVNGTGVPGATGGQGGGIFNAGSMISTSCTIALNLTGAGGQGGNSVERGESSDIATFGGAGGSGGGIFAADNSTNLLRNTLVALNSVNLGALGGTNFNQGNFLPFPGGSSSNPLIIGNPGPDGSGPDLAGAFQSEKFNLIGIADGSTGVTNGINADLAGSLTTPLDPALGPLQMNGGPTPTHALLPQSPAIDQGFSFGSRYDQRGDKRPYDDKALPNAIGGDGSDIGAFELEIPFAMFSGTPD